LERNLYLAVQFMELGVPLILVLNMSDVAAQRGHKIDTVLLSRLFGVTIVRTSASRGDGIDDLKDAIAAAATRPPTPPVCVRHGRELDAEVDALSPWISRSPALAARAEWSALKLLEGDEEVRRVVESAAEDAPALLAAAEASRERIRKHFGDLPETVIADQRYGFISGACHEAVQAGVETRVDVSDRIDAVLAHHLLGLPIFFAMMYLMFKFVFGAGEPAMQGIEALFARLGDAVTAVWPAVWGDSLRSLVTDGIIGGVGGVLVFLPNIVLLFLSIAILEDSGYMARAAFIMDRVMHRIGLHGKSFIPMLIGFGCTVPAIMATRTLESRRDRMITMLILPLISCGARLPIYALFVSAFFPQAWRTPLLMLLYLIGLGLAVVVAKILQKTAFREDSPFFVIELPPYRMPTLNGLFFHTWDRAKQFLRKAGTVVLGLSIVLWCLTSYPRQPESALRGMSAKEAQAAGVSYSVAGRIGHALEPIMRPIGFDWRSCTALVGALAAKEVFVSQLSILNALGEGGSESSTLRQKLQGQYTRLQAFCIMLFCLISMPCMMTVATVRQESGSWRWALLQMTGLTAFAYVACFVVFQAGSALGL
jgi:ferrous iron transport protein B